MAHIGFITAGDLSRFFPSKSEPLLTHDDAVAARFLRAAGHEVTPIPWGTPAPRCGNGALDLALIRSPWDYSDSPETSQRFFHWLEEFSHDVPVWNPVPLMLWNLDKHYLGTLASAGVPVVATEFIEAQDPLTEDLLAEWCRQRGALVLKPCISAGARDTFLIRSPDDAYNLRGAYGKVDRALSSWRGDRAFMLQPFLEEVQERGEWSLVFIDGTHTHAVHKVPGTGEWLVQDELGGSVYSRTPSAAVVTAAQKAYDCTVALCAEGKTAGLVDTPPPLYARIDVIETAHGPRVGEVELVEPELFFKLRHPHDGPCLPALEALATAVSRSV